MKLSRVTPFTLLAASCQAAYVQFQDCADTSVSNKSLIPESFRASVGLGGDGFEWRFDVIAGQAERNACEIDIGDVVPRFTVIDYGSDPKEISGEIVNMSCYTSEWLGPRAHFTIASSFKRSAFLDTFRTTLEMTSKDNESLSCIRAVLTPAAPESIRLLSLWLPIATFALTCIAACWPAQQPTSSLTSKSGRIARAINLLAYIQFMFFSGALSLRYPGFFQPLVGLYSWSTLMLPAGLVETDSPYPRAGVKDGIYEHNGTITGAPGLELLTQMTGSPVKPQSWMNTFVLSLLIFFFLYLSSYISFRLSHREPISNFTLATLGAQLKDRYWTVVRIFLSCFMLPISAWATYQFLDDQIFGYRNSAMAIITLIVLLAGFWWSWTRDSDMGSLVIQSPGRLNKDPESGRQYYALVLFSLMFLRGSVIGGLQTYTSVQLGVLLGCEIIQLLAMTFWTRFACFISLTGILSVSRLALFALHIGFVPGLASHSGRMLVAYIILCGHVIVLTLIFLLPAAIDMAHLIMYGRAVTMSDAERGASVREVPRPVGRVQTDIESLQKSEPTKNTNSNRHTQASSPDFNKLLLEMILKREKDNSKIGPASQKALTQFLEDSKAKDKRAEIKKSPKGFSDSSNISVVDLLSHLFSEQNSAVRSTPLHHNLDRPINEYFISSSHNTYLRGRQVAARSKLKGYISTLSQGCRSVEVDCWDGRDGQPIVKHGYSLTTSISFRSVIETINNYAFFASDLPLWLSLEVHCSPAQRDIMARTMLEIFRSSLVVEPLDASAQKLPSPNQLRGKILLKVKVAQTPEPLQESLAPEYLNLDGAMEDVEIDDPQDLPGDLLQSLAVYGASRRLPKDAEFDTHRNFIYSVSERNFKKHNRENCSLELARTHHLVRVYPDPNRVDSSNFDPLQCWRHGVQMAALNCQTDDFYMSLNQAMFHGSLGYVLKDRPQPTKIRLQVDVLMAQGLKVSTGSGPVYAKIQLIAPDTLKQKARTAAISVQGSDVTLDENLEMSMETNYPYLTFLHWSVKTMSNGCSMSIASGTAKLDNSQVLNNGDQNPVGSTMVTLAVRVM
ncbi:1-phosphatidylinositol-4 5-bisphosphate phosphodiesterase 1 [Fusarium tjaetaba]|uniref:Phosphoinositide phospholipase C n=1 Tax=Fusarium tjaetaba TaxID=1567544 RepID=A0A8H5RZB9_9HYPO|nr:1-phosphatidylinositol-4 5-bisphosphate phosphodiesterase 1 [Fusarium tjaetaba]KAF5642478.1 1-phosphatidylinositol-4 5-bisphosphate phosphodiesterase 1 [Fusarium tjaetaba]